jgi:pantothenate synthetase
MWLTPLLQDARALQLAKRSLESALAASQREAFALASQLERAESLARELEEAQRESSAARAQASSARARITLLEKAWASALEVRCWAALVEAVGLQTHVVLPRCAGYVFPTARVQPICV